MATSDRWLPPVLQETAKALPELCSPGPQHEGGNKLLCQLGKSGQYFAGEKQQLLSGHCSVSFPSAAGKPSGAREIQTGAETKGNLLSLWPLQQWLQANSHPVVNSWVHEKTTAVGRMPVGSLSSWSRLQSKWLLRSAWVQSAVLLLAVLMPTLPDSSVLSPPSEEDGWTCPTVSYIRGTGREPHPAWWQGCSQLCVCSHTLDHLKQGFF